MDRKKYDMLLAEMWQIMSTEYMGKDIEVAMKIRSQFERIGTVTDILRNAAEKSSLSKFNGSLYCFTGQIYEMITPRDVKNIIYDLMTKMGCPRADFYRKDLITRDVIDVLEKDPLEVRNEIVVFNNCVLDTNTMKTYEHGKEWAQVTKLDYDYNPHTNIFLWYKFLNEVLPDRDMQKILQQFLGAVFVDRNLAKIETMLILKGSGSNGKSVVFETVMGVLGRDNVSNFGLGVLVGGGDRKMNVASMNGKRLNYCSEIQIKEFGNNSDSLKALISGEPIEARQIYGTNFTARNIPLLMANANRLPYIKDISHGMARRLCVIDFKVEIPKEKQNKSLASDLVAEYPGIFNWIMEGKRDFVANKYKLPITSDLDEALEEYKSETDSVLAFMQDMRYARTANIKETDIIPRWLLLGKLYDDYLRWCTRNHSAEVRTKNLFSRTLSEAGYRRDKKNGGVCFAIYMKYDTSYDVHQDIAQKKREDRHKHDIIRIEGKNYARGVRAITAITGANTRIIEKMTDQGKMTDCIFTAEGGAIYYDIDAVLDLLEKEGYYMGKKEVLEQREQKSALRVARNKFNEAMKSHGLPYRKGETTAARLDGTIHIDDKYSVEEAVEKAKMEGYLASNEQTSDEGTNDLDDLLEGVEEEIQNNQK